MLNMPRRESSGVTWCSQDLRTSRLGHFSWKMLSKAPAAGALVLLMLLEEESLPVEVLESALALGQT